MLPSDELRAEVLAVFERTFAVTTALQALAAIVARRSPCAGADRARARARRELAVLRVLGGSRAQLGGLVAGQALFLGLAGALGGLAVGLVVG